MQDDLYQKMYQLEHEHWWFVARRRVIATAMRRQGIGKGNNVLEVGCGTGGNIGFLSEFGNLTCIEQSPGAVELANRQTSVPVLQGSLPDRLPEFDQVFDLICLLDVI